MDHCAGGSTSRVDSHVFLARARYENCSPGLKLSSSARASSSGILALSCRGCTVTSKVGGGGSRTDPAHEVHGHGTVPADICPRKPPSSRVIVLSKRHLPQPDHKPNSASQ